MASARLLILYLLLIILILALKFKYNKGAATDSGSIENTWFGGVCGNTLFEVHSTDYNDDDVVGLNSSINKITRFDTEQVYRKTKEERHSKSEVKFWSRNGSRTGELDPFGAMERLKREYVKVRLNIVYDSSFEEEFPQKDDLENYVRNLIFATQFIFNQRDLYKHVRINLVVVMLQKSSSKISPKFDARDILNAFMKGRDMASKNYVDLNLLLTFRNLWSRLGSNRGNMTETKEGRMSGRTTKILGQAGLGTFCSPIYEAALIAQIPSLGSAVVLAHEIAHAFGVEHDGIGSSYSCKSDYFIMYPSIGDNRLHWSECSIDRILHQFILNSECIFNEARIKSAVPIKPLFDLNPEVVDNTNLKLLPGQQMPIDAQCAQALDENATSSLNKFGRNGNERYDTCQSLVCSVGGYMEVAIGPAPAGSQCRQKNSYCLEGYCTPKGE